MKRKLEEKTPKEQRAIKLIKSITTGDVAEAKQLISEMSNEEINAIIDRSGSTALHLAAFEGMKEVCELILTKNPETINAVTKDSYTALHFAAVKGHNEVCKLLIPKMTSEAINTADKNGHTALILAAFEGMKEVCELILTKNPEAINVNDNKGSTALHVATSGGHKEICKVLIENIPINNSVGLLNKSNNETHIQKVIGKIVADFMNDKFLGSEVNQTDFTNYQIKLLKLYQVVNRDLLKSYLNQEKSISEVNNYITKHYFTLIGVYKSINEDSPISKLVISDCMPHMLFYLAPHSLCPELFPTELSGEEAVVSSEN
jgi:hypothetical protein